MEDNDDVFFFSLPFPKLLLRIYPTLLSTSIAIAAAASSSKEKQPTDEDNAIIVSVVIPAFNERSGS